MVEFTTRVQAGSDVHMGIHARPLLTIADLDSMAEYGNRYELIEGELFVSSSVNGAKTDTGDMFFSLPNYKWNAESGDVAVLLVAAL